jgi:trk system potassium uptake protein TrkA
MDIVIVGAGEVGSAIGESLAGNHDVTVVDIDPQRVDEVTYDLDVLALQGDGTDSGALREAGAPEADLFIASTDNDETNIVACGTAKALGSPFTIARVGRRQFLDTWQQGKRVFGVDFMVCTDLSTAQVMVDVVGLPTARDVDTFANGSIQMAEFDIPPGSPITDRTVAEADTFETLTFAAIIRDDEFVTPSGETVIKADDDVVVIGTPGAVRRFSTEIAPDSTQPSDIVIVGGSEIGYQTARLLEKDGFKPRLVERDEERAQWLAEHLTGTTVLKSDATDSVFLEREHVGQADVVISTLENDQQNLMATLLAKRLGAKRAVAIVDTVAFSDLFEAVGVDVAVSPREIVAEEITRFTRSRRAENVSIIERDRAEVLEFEIDADSVVADSRIRDLAADLPEGFVIGAIMRDGSFVTPRGDTVIHTGDHVVVFAEARAIDDILDLF